MSFVLFVLFVVKKFCQKPACWSGRTNNKKRSAPGIRENAPHLDLYKSLRPVGVLGAQTGSLHFARGPVKTLGYPESFLAGHGAKDFNLFRTGLFIRQHGASMRRCDHWRKRKAVLRLWGVKPRLALCGQSH